MKNVKFFNGQVTEADDFNNAQEYKAQEIKNTRLDTRTIGIIESESSNPLIQIDTDKRIGIFGLVAYDCYGNRIVVPNNENPAEPYIGKLLPDATGKLVQVDGNPLQIATEYTLVIRHATIMAPPVKHHYTTGEMHLITEEDTFEFYLRDKGGETEGDVVLCNIAVDDAGGITVDYSAADYSYIRPDEVVGSLSGTISGTSGDSYSGNISFEQHINAVGTGIVNSKNPHGLSAADIGIDIGALADHQTLLHCDGIRSDNILSTTSAMYPHYVTETAVADTHEVVYIEPLSTSLREIVVINGQSVTPVDFSSTYSYSFSGKAAPEYEGYYLASYDLTTRAIVMNGPFGSEASSGFVMALNTTTLFPICSFKFAYVSYDVTGDGVADVEGNYDIIPGTFKDRRKFNNISIANIRPDEVFALSQFAPYCNDRAYLHNARVISSLNSPSYYVLGTQLSITVDGDTENPIVVTFTSSNPVSTQRIVEQIISAAATVDNDGYTYLRVYPRITDDGYISLSAPLSIEINVLPANDAGPILGFTATDGNLRDSSDIIKELIYVGDRNGIVLFTYDANDNVTQIDYLLGGGVRRFNKFTYNGELITSVREGVTTL